MTATADEQKIIERARRWDETRKAKALAARNGSSPQEKARVGRAHFLAGNDLSEAIEKALKPPQRTRTRQLQHRTAGNGHFGKHQNCARASAKNNGKSRAELRGTLKGK